MNQETITNIQTKLSTGKFSAMEAVEARSVLVGYYAFYSEQLEDILIRKPKVWDSIRNQTGVKSDKQADRLYEMTDDGVNEIGLSMRLKRFEKMLSVLKTIIDVNNTMFRHTE